MRKILMCIMIMALTACGGNGGGNSEDGASPAPLGSAEYNDLIYGYASNVCFSMAPIGTPASCSVRGTPNNQTSSATCSTGTPSVVCNVGGTSYALVTGGSTAADQACVAAGGIVQVSCPINTNSACSLASGVWTSANYPNVATQVSCANAGGIFYSTLQNLVGSIPTANLSAGNNIIRADPNEVAAVLGFFDGINNLDNTNLSLVSMSAVATISNYWEHSFYLNNPSIYNFRSTAVEFTAVSPIGTNSAIKIKANSVKIYFK